MADVTVTTEMVNAGASAYLDACPPADTMETAQPWKRDAAIATARCILEAALAHAPPSEREAELVARVAELEKETATLAAGVCLHDLIAGPGGHFYCTGIRAVEAQRDQLAADNERLREALEKIAERDSWDNTHKTPIASDMESFVSGYNTAAGTRANRARETLSSTPPQALAARAIITVDEELEALKKQGKATLESLERLATHDSLEHERTREEMRTGLAEAREKARDGEVLALRAVLQLAKDEPRRSMEGDNRFWFLLDEALTNSEQAATDAEDRIRADERENCAKIAENLTSSEHIAMDIEAGIFPVRSTKETAIAQAIRDAMKDGGDD